MNGIVIPVNLKGSEAGKFFRRNLLQGGAYNSSQQAGYQTNGGYSSGQQAGYRGNSSYSSGQQAGYQTRNSL